MINTLLTMFIKMQLAAYVHPDRTGVAKGDLIGFSRPKFESVLLGMTLMPKKDISDLVGASYDVLKAWRWQEEYKKRLERYERQFSRMFVDELTAYAREYGIYARGQESLAFPGIIHNLHALLPFSDVAIFNDEIAERIFTDADSTDAPEPSLKAVLKQVLDFLFLIRSGYQRISDEGKLEVLDDRIVSYKAPNGYTEFFNASKFLKKRWRAPKEVIQRELKQFIRRLRGGL